MRVTRPCPPVRKDLVTPRPFCFCTIKIRTIKILKVSSSFLGTKTRILSIEGWLDRPTNGHTYVSRMEIFNKKLVGPKIYK